MKPPLSCATSEAMLRVLIFAYVVRTVQALLLHTYFNPDEYWQCLEVAHFMVFGYGHRTWEWAAGLRGYLHPTIFAALYKVLLLMKLDTPWTVTKAPQLLQAFFAAVTDLYVYKLACLQFGLHVARWTLLCQVTSWFNAYCLIRTYSNSFETLCLVMGTYYWLSSTQGQLTHLYTAPDTGHRAQGGSATQADMVPQPQRAGSAEEHAQGNESATEHGGSAAEHAQPVEQCVQQVNSTVKAAAGQAVTVANASNNTTASGGAEAAGMLQCPFSQSAATLGTTGWVQLHTHRQKALCLAAVGVLFRPSSIMFWLPYGMLELATPSGVEFALEAVLIGGSMLLAGACIDRLGYGRWVLVPWEFVKFNLLQGGSAMYGSHPWHWNFTQGFPTISLTFTPLMLWGIYKSPSRRALAFLAGWSMLSYSLPAHKEFRFLLPALNLLMPYCGVALAECAARFRADKTDAPVSKVNASSKAAAGYDGKPFQYMDIGYHSRLNALTAALTAQQPPRELPGSSRPVRPRQPLSVLQLPRPQKAPAKPGNCPFAVPAKTHTCPFATPDQANSHHLGQHRTSEQQQPSAQGSTQAWQTPAGQTLAAEAAPTAGVDLAAVEAELDSFADTFAIQPDEALLHAYASLLAEKVAEADDTAEAIAKPEATAKPDAATKAEANEQAEATAEPEAVAKPEVTAKFEADAVTAYQAEALPGILSSASSTTAAPVSFSADSVRNAAPSATSTAVTPALFRKGKNAGVEQSDDTASDENRGMDIHMCQSHKQALDSADGTDVHSQQHCTAKQTVPLQSRLSGQQETAKRWLSRSSQMLQNAHADAQLPGHVNDEDAFRAASKCCNSSFSSSTYAEHSRGDAMAGSTGLWQSSVQTWQDCWMWLGKRSVVWHVLTVICFGVQVMIAAYFGLVHQRGQIDVMQYLGQEADLQPNMSVLFLTPCHATPYYSHIHRNISMDFLDCTPTGWADATRYLNTKGCSDSTSLQQQQQPSQKLCTAGESERQQFERSPTNFLQSRWAKLSARDLPSHLVMFQALAPIVRDYVTSRYFGLHKSIFNCHVQVDAGKEVWVWKRLESYPWQQ